jgi:protein TonB
MKPNLFIGAMLLVSFFSVGQTDSTEVEIFEDYEEYAEFPGGPAALKKYLAENLNYPESAIKKKIEGSVYVRFLVTKNGEISNLQVKKSIPDCSECSEEAIRVFKSMPRWIPAKNNGEIVDSYFNSKVTFKH